MSKPSETEATTLSREHIITPQPAVKAEPCVKCAKLALKLVDLPDKVMARSE